MADQDPERRPALMVFVGVRRGKDKKKSYLWREIPQDANNGEPYPEDDFDIPSSATGMYSGSKKNLSPSAVVGSVISIDVAPDGTTCYPSTSRLLGSWKNEEDVVRWRAESRAIEGEIEFDQKAAKEARQDLPKETLEPFRHAYWLCRNARQRAQLLGWIIEQVTSGQSLK